MAAPRRSLDTEIAVFVAQKIPSLGILDVGKKIAMSCQTERMSITLANSTAAVSQLVLPW